MNHTRVSSSCNYGVPWPWSFFVSCVDTGQQMAGVVFGIIAVLLWIGMNGLLVHIRHIDYKAERMAVGWLVVRSVADLMNSMGTLMARQFAQQVWFAMAMLLCDVMLCTHYVVVRIMHIFYLPKPSGDVCNTYQPPEDADDDEEDDVIDEPSQWQHVKNLFKYKIKNFPFMDRMKRSKSLNALCFTTPWLLVFAYVKAGFLPEPRVLPPGPHIHHSRTLMQTSTAAQKSFDPLGYTLGVASSFLYWLEMLPLIVQTVKEQALTRLEMIYQLLYILSSVFYLLAVFVQLNDGWLFAHTLPWTIGRIVLIILGVAILGKSHVIALRSHYWTISDEDSLLRDGGANPGDWLTLSEKDMEAKPWTPLKPLAKNRYLQKMSKLAEHMESKDKFADGEKEEAVLFDKSCVQKTPDDSTHIPISRLTPPPIDSDLEWEFDWKGDDVRYELDEDEINKLLEEEAATWPETRPQTAKSTQTGGEHT